MNKMKMKFLSFFLENPGEIAIADVNGRNKAAFLLYCAFYMLCIMLPVLLSKVVKTKY